MPCVLENLETKEVKGAPPPRIEIQGFRRTSFDELCHILDRLEIAMRKFKSGRFSTLMDAIVATRRTIIKLGERAAVKQKPQALAEGAVELIKTIVDDLESGKIRRVRLAVRSLPRDPQDGGKSQ